MCVCFCWVLPELSCYPWSQGPDSNSCVAMLVLFFASIDTSLASNNMMICNVPIFVLNFLSPDLQTGLEHWCVRASDVVCLVICHLYVFGTLLHEIMHHDC